MLISRHAWLIPICYELSFKKSCPSFSTGDALMKKRVLQCFFISWMSRKPHLHRQNYMNFIECSSFRKAKFNSLELIHQTPQSLENERRHNLDSVWWYCRSHTWKAPALSVDLVENFPSFNEILVGKHVLWKMVTSFSNAGRVAHKTCLGVPSFSGSPYLVPISWFLLPQTKAVAQTCTLYIYTLCIHVYTYLLKYSVIEQAHTLHGIANNYSNSTSYWEIFRIAWRSPKLCEGND